MDGYAKLVRALVYAAIAAALYFAGRELVSSVIGFFQAPLQAELNASRGNQAAGKAANDHQSAAVDALKTGSDKKKAVSRAAVAKAGEKEFADAAAIAAKPAPGATAVDRAVNRINAELGIP